MTSIKGILPNVIYEDIDEDFNNLGEKFLYCDTKCPKSVIEKGLCECFTSLKISKSKKKKIDNKDNTYYDRRNRFND